MHLIWYNTLSQSYECGEAKLYGAVISGLKQNDILTVLMEFSENEKDLALKTMVNLNNARIEKISSKFSHS